MLWGGRLLISADTLPQHVDEAVVLQGSILGENARIRGALTLLQENVASRMLLSLPSESYWGQAMPPVAHAYIEKHYGHDLADRIDFCETGPEVDSTEQEAAVLLKCIRGFDRHSVAVVTSDYHTRRAGIIWKKILREQNSPVQIYIHPVPDPEFQTEWWQKRRSAKTWLHEVTKLIWTMTFDRL